MNIVNETLTVKRELDNKVCEERMNNRIFIDLRIVDKVLILLLLILSSIDLFPEILIKSWIAYTDDFFYAVYIMVLIFKEMYWITRKISNNDNNNEECKYNGNNTELNK